MASTESVSKKTALHNMSLASGLQVVNEGRPTAYNVPRTVYRELLYLLFPN